MGQRVIEIYKSKGKQKRKESRGAFGAPIPIDPRKWDIMLGLEAENDLSSNYPNSRRKK